MADHAPGTPSWVDLSTPDPEGALAFYNAVFGWEVAEADGGYQHFTHGGAAVGGLLQTMSEGQPTTWSTYVNVADANATARAVATTGGMVMIDPTDVPGIGRMAVFADPAGAVFGVWQPGFGGAELVNEPGSLCWNELVVPDGEVAKVFYGAVFGWTAGPGPAGDDDPYTVWLLDGREIAGMMPMDEIPPHWGVCFAVADTDATVAAAEAAGADIAVPATDMPIGRFAVMADPQGASFAVMQLA